MIFRECNNGNGRDFEASCSRFEDYRNDDADAPENAEMYRVGLPFIFKDIIMPGHGCPSLQLPAAGTWTMEEYVTRLLQWWRLRLDGGILRAPPAWVCH